jgi:hypothetical protein
MANLDTRSKRASSVGIMLPFFAVPPLPDGTLGEGDRKHIAFSYSGLSDAVLTFVLDLNTRILVFLRDQYSVAGGDLTTLSARYMNGLTTGDRTAKFRQLVTNATNAMT